MNNPSIELAYLILKKCLNRHGKDLEIVENDTYIDPKIEELCKDNKWAIKSLEIFKEHEIGLKLKY